MNDTISRQEAKDAIDMALDHIDHVPPWVYDKLLNALNEVPSAEPEAQPISYKECANAMLKMWIDNVLTDGEYNRIMDKLNSKHMADMGGDSDE